jgi:hypothetical protein
MPRFAEGVIERRIRLGAGGEGDSNFAYASPPGLASSCMKIAQ